MKRTLLPFAFAALLVPAVAQSNPSPVAVCTSTPDLGSLAREVGGDLVRVTTFVKGPEDPHFAEPRPSFVKALSDAELWIEVGLELETGWAPVLLVQSHNPRVQVGAPGHLDASTAVTPIGAPKGKLDRSLGDVHAAGNPHYLLDPRNGWLVACRIRDALGELRPERKAEFAARCAEFGTRLGAAVVGKDLATKYEWQKLVVLHEHGKLAEFLKAQGDAKVAGWLGRLEPFRGSAIVVDHDLWPYFTRTFGLTTVATLEPLPGVPPTTKHLMTVVTTAKAANARAILASPYYDPRHAAFVAKETGATVVALAHQTGGRPGAEDYVAMLDTNVRKLAEALGGKR